jgi:hypothetical protein
MMLAHGVRFAPDTPPNIFFDSLVTSSFQTSCGEGISLNPCKILNRKYLLAKYSWVRV